MFVLTEEKREGNDNRSLGKARNNKNDEFYTRLEDIEDELIHYKHHFKDKVVYCNCDDPRISNFYQYFSNNFEQLGLRKLITTCYVNQNVDLFNQDNFERAIKLEYTGEVDDNGVPVPDDVEYLKGDGDFRSAECIELLKEADIVVTNPPFSLFREHITQLMNYNKMFLVLGNLNAVTYKEIFPLIQNNEIWLGNKSGDMAFRVPDYYQEKSTRFWVDETGQKWRSLGNVTWYTNLDHNKRHEELMLTKTYNAKEYPNYDNYDGIEVSKVADIPKDFDGVMGVPITFMDKYNPEQFEIVGADNHSKDNKGNNWTGQVGGEFVYKRVLIRNKKVEK